jgi:MFS superfamily sulfate permease-like transporter
VANIVNGFFSSFVVNDSPTKTGISDRSGTRSQMAMVVLALITIPVLLFLTGVFASLPEATLAAVVCVIAIHLMKIDTLRMLYRLPNRGEFWVAATTAAFVALVGVGGGIVYAIVASIVVHLAQTSRPNNSVLLVEADGTRRQLAVVPGIQTAPGLIIYRFAANLFYANSARLVADVRELLAGAPDPVRLFVLDASEVHSVDWTSAEALRKCVQMAHEAGATFQVARLPEEARALLDYHGISDEIGGEAGYADTVRHALKGFAASPGAEDPAQ